MEQKTEFDYSKLRGRITEICGTQIEFAARMGKNRSLINVKLNNVSEFTQREIADACEILAIPKRDIGAYFFTSKVVK